MIGYLGNIVFETSDQRILTFSGFSLSNEPRFATHEIIGQKPITEFIGPGLSSISFSIKLNAGLGVIPRDELDNLLAYCESGDAMILSIGGRPVGDNLWIIKSIGEVWNTFLNGGQLYSANVDVSLEEYVEETA